MNGRGPEGIHFDESFSRSFVLAEKFRKAEVIGEKTQEQNNVANVKIEEILSTSFPIHYQSEQQYDSIPQYKSVQEMIYIKNTPGKLAFVKEHAEKSLFEIGLALSQNKDVLKAATEGSDELNKLLPSNLHEIQPYILSVILTEGRDDVQGQELVVELVDLFKLRKKAEVIHGRAQTDYEEKKDSFLNKLYDLSQEIVDEAALGRIETMMGYVLGIGRKEKNERSITTNGINNVDENGDVVTDEEMTIWLEQERKAREEAEAKGDRENYKSPMWLMNRDDIVDEEMQQRGKQQFHLSPPYPQWFKELSQKNKDLWRVRCKLINGVAWKQIIRNKDVEKLMSNEAIDLSRAELKLLYEMPHFKEALKIYFNDLFMDAKDSPEGRNMLRIRREKGPNDTRGTIIAAGVEEKLLHFQAYKEKMALRMQYPGKDDKWYNDRYETYVKTSNEILMGQKLGEAKKLLANDEYRGAVAAAWSFLYIGNTIESADVDRQLKPSEIVSDKLRSMIHPLQKAMGKWGIYKEGSVQGHKGVYKNEEKPKEYDKITGEEEPMGGPIAGWVKYHLEMDEIRANGEAKNVDYQNSFRKKLADHEPGYRPFPERMATSLVEWLKVNIEDENGDLVMDKDDKEKPVEIPMSRAIMENMRITFDVVKINLKDSKGNYKKETKSEAIRKGHQIISHEYEGHDYDTCVGFRDAMDGCFTAFNYLTGKVKPEKNVKDWALGFDKDISLIRQNATKYYNDSESPSYLKFVDNPEFVAWVIAGSFGLEQSSEQIVLDLRGSIPTFRDNYYNTIREIVNQVGLTKFGVDKSKIMSYLSAPDSHNKTYWGLGKIQSEMLKNERLRQRYLRNNKLENSDQW